MKRVLFLFLFCGIFPGWAGNQTLTSFTKTKQLLKNVVYRGHPETFYCHAPFDGENNITLPQNFKAPSQIGRSQKLEWEHVVPAQHFGQTFAEWRNGHPQCVDKKGKPFRGRKCAEKTNPEFRLMLCDMYNLYPAIGAVNALRSNFNYADLPEIQATFGACPMKIHGKQVEPPPYTRGAIARTYLYFETEYPRYQMSPATRQLMQAWDKMYPVDDWECERAERIEKLQGNVNQFVHGPCLKRKTGGNL